MSPLFLKIATSFFFPPVNLNPTYPIFIYMKINFFSTKLERTLIIFRHFTKLYPESDVNLAILYFFVIGLSKYKYIIFKFSVSCTSRPQTNVSKTITPIPLSSIFSSSISSCIPLLIPVSALKIIKRFEDSLTL